MEQPKVSVAIMKEPIISFFLNGDFSSPNFDEIISGVCNVEFEGQTIRLSDGKKNIVVENEIILNPINYKSSSFVLKDVTIGIQFHWQQTEDQKFLGSLKFLIEDNKLAAINILPIEDYLTSVISSEMSAKSSMELLKAHAVISRSWLLAQINKQKEIHASSEGYISEIKNENEFIKWFDREDHTLYDVCADDHCQRYQGVTKLYESNAQKAVEETYGKVLTENGKICDARFSKSCGGVSENFENVWEPVKHSYLTAVGDNEDQSFNDLTNEENAVKWIRGNDKAFCNTSDKNILNQVLVDFDQSTTDFYRWKVEYTQKEISELISRRLEFDFGEIVDFVPMERGKSARLIKLKIVGTKRTLIIGKELIIRKALSESHLYSSAIVFEKLDLKGVVPQKFVLYGAGWGHGVGLCQIGAAVMGEKGYSFSEILEHYFKSAQLENIYT